MIRFFHIKKQKHWEQGVSLIEVLVATAIISIVLTSIVAGLSYTVKVNSEAKYRSIATQLAHDGIEFFVREKELKGWAVFYNSFESCNYCLSTIPEYDPGRQVNLVRFNNSCQDILQRDGVDLKANFKRQVKVTKVIDMYGKNYLEVAVKVDWPGSQTGVVINRQFWEI